MLELQLNAVPCEQEQQHWGISLPAVPSPQAIQPPFPPDTLPGDSLRFCWEAHSTHHPLLRRAASQRVGWCLVTIQLPLRPGCLVVLLVFQTCRSQYPEVRDKKEDLRSSLSLVCRLDGRKSSFQHRSNFSGLRRLPCILYLPGRMI